jgi:catechol 2,3-dioxygenase-like lactoylglutathione lyase family enzyme
MHRMHAIRRLVEVVLTVDDMDRSLAFYRDVLGLEVFSPAGVPAKFLRIGGHDGRSGIPQQIVLVPRAAVGDQPLAPSRRLHHIGLEVAPETYDAERERLAGLGYALRRGTHPFMPVEAFYLDDPDGNEVEIATWRG